MDKDSQTILSKTDSKQSAPAVGSFKGPASLEPASQDTPFKSAGFNGPVESESIAINPTKVKRNPEGSEGESIQVRNDRGSANFMFNPIISTD